MSSWTEQPKAVFEFRLKRLRIYDTLLSESKKYRVDCIDEHGAIRYIVAIDDVDVLKRRKVDSIVEYLVENNAPLDMKIINDGALWRIQEDEDEDENINNMFIVTIKNNLFLKNVSCTYNTNLFFARGFMPFQ